MRIPTLLGLILLIIALALGIFLSYQYADRQNQIRLLYNPHNIQIVNITNSSASIVWQTEIPANGLIKWGKEKLVFFKFDDRDSQLQLKRNLHFVTIEGLEPDTQYSFATQNDDLLYEDVKQNFSTAKKQASQSLANKPIIGTILTSGYEPETEAIISFNTEGGSALATYALSGGNFLLPTTQLKKKNLEEDLPLKDNTQATLTVYSAKERSIVKISLSNATQTPYQIVLGKDVDLTQIPSPSKIDNPLDLNNDGEVNALDLSIVLDNFGKNPKEKKADINQDGVVDDKDLKELKAVLR